VNPQQQPLEHEQQPQQQQQCLGSNAEERRWKNFLTDLSMLSPTFEELQA
jgi:hypothetical protein